MRPYIRTHVAATVAADLAASSPPHAWQIDPETGLEWADHCTACGDAVCWEATPTYMRALVALPTTSAVPPAPAGECWDCRELRAAGLDPTALVMADSADGVRHPARCGQLTSWYQLPYFRTVLTPDEAQEAAAIFAALDDRYTDIARERERLQITARRRPYLALRELDRARSAAA